MKNKRKGSHQQIYFGPESEQDALQPYYDRLRQLQPLYGADIIGHSKETKNSTQNNFNATQAYFSRIGSSNSTTTLKRDDEDKLVSLHNFSSDLANAPYETMRDQRKGYKINSTNYIGNILNLKNNGASYSLI